MNAEQQLTSHRLWLSVLDLDLQLYKGSIYKLRWGTPGGLDMALPCYDRALVTLDSTLWPVDLKGPAVDLRDRVSDYRRTLEAKDVTSASARQSRMMSAFDHLRDLVSAWPDGPRISDRVGGAQGVQGGRDAMDEVAPSS